jgi:hypothetical protein
VKLRGFAVLLAAWLVSPAPRAHAKTSADAYFGYSRVGANMYAVYTPGMNGWQFAMHVKPIPFVGVEGDVSHYGQTLSDFTQHVTLVMFGPRVTVHAAGLSLFAHGLGGAVHQSGKIPFYQSTEYTATSYALGGGADLPLFLGFKIRITGDYLGNTSSNISGYSSGGGPSHIRAGVGLAYHF